MIVYNNILGKLSAAGWSTYRLQHENILGNGTIIQIRAGKPITTRTIDIICGLLQCQPNEILTWQPDKEAEE